MGYYTAATGRLGSRSTLDSDTYTPAASVSVRLVVDGTDIDAYIDASHKIDTSDSTHAAGGVAFAGEQAKFDDLAIGYDANADGDLNDANDTKPVAETFASTTTTFTYDDAGNLIDDGSFRYTYDAWNRLVKVTAATDTDVTFHVREYYGDGRWSKKTVTNAGQYKGAVVPYYDGWRIVATYDGSGNPYQQFVHGTQYIDERIMMRVADKGEFYVHQDANWNVIALTDLGGQVVERYSYTPYGELTVDQLTSFGDYNGDHVVNATDRSAITGICAGSDPTGECRILDMKFDGEVNAADLALFDALTQGIAKHPNQTASAVDMPFAHQGLYLDAELGSYQNRHRQYAPVGRRFMQRDPLALRVSTRRSYAANLRPYAYLNGDPIRGVDPYGLDGIDCTNGCGVSDGSVEFCGCMYRCRTKSTVTGVMECLDLDATEITKDGMLCVIGCAALCTLTGPGAVVCVAACTGACGVGDVAISIPSLIACMDIHKHTMDSARDAFCGCLNDPDDPVVAGYGVDCSGYDLGDESPGSPGHPGEGPLPPEGGVPGDPVVLPPAAGGVWR